MIEFIIIGAIAGVGLGMMLMYLIREHQAQHSKAEYIISRWCPHCEKEVLIDIIWNTGEVILTPLTNGDGANDE